MLWTLTHNYFCPFVLQGDMDGPKSLQGQEEVNMLHRWTACAVFALLIAGGSCSAVAAGAGIASPQYGYGAERGEHAGWDTPPQDFTQTQANGFHDGIAAAHDDIAHHAQPNATARPEYRNPPPMSFMQRVMYRDGFQKGYQRAMDRFYGVQPPPPAPVAPPPPPPPPVAGPGPYFEIRHRGFQDGMDGALRDLDNHRRPDPNNRDEFRYPQVPPEMAEPYRDGFRHGYDILVHTLLDSGDDWQHGPFGQVHMQGFHEGAIGAIRDYDNHRSVDPNNRDEYRSPRVPPQFAEAYRDGFRRGYQKIANELYNYLGRH